MDVTVSGTIGCATFPFTCAIRLRVVSPGTTISPNWRPAASDPWWGPDWSTGMNATRLDPTVRSDLPELWPGHHVLVVSILGSSDLPPSLNPDESPVGDVIGRCQTEIAVDPSELHLLVGIVLSQGDAGHPTSCSIGANALYPW
jgi:hypothetical protein